MNRKRMPVKVVVTTLFIEPGSPWENGYDESFNGKLRYELLNGEIFHTLQEAQILIERWRPECNRIRPHSALGYRPPAPKAVAPWMVLDGWTSARKFACGVESYYGGSR